VSITPTGDVPVHVRGHDQGNDHDHGHHHDHDDPEWTSDLEY
jgi:hypothetical protein